MVKESRRRRGEGRSASRKRAVKTSGTSRRAFLAGVGATGSVGLTGCLETLGSGGGSDTVTVGFVVAQSGSYSLLGETTIQGFEHYVDEELDGTLGGREVEYVTRDTEGDPARGTTIAREFITRQGVDFLVGPIGGNVAGAVRGVVESNLGEVIWISSTGIGWEWPRDTPTEDVSVACTEYQFITSDAYYQPAAPMADYAIENLGETAVLTYADYSAGHQYTGLFRDRFEELGGEVVGEVGIPLGTEDFQPYLQNIDTSADLLFSFFAGSDAINYVKQLHSSGIDQEIQQCGTGFLLESDILPAQGEAAVGKYSALHYTPAKDTPRNNEFVETFQASYDRLPNVYACAGYDSAQIADEAIHEVGGTDADDLASAIKGLEIDSPRGYFRMTDSAPYHPIQDVDIRRVEPGEGDAPPSNEVVDTVERIEAPFTCS